MRSIFYSETEIADAFHFWAPKLREYAASCRLRDPLPDRGSLSAAQHEQYRILCQLLTEFRDAPIRLRKTFLEIYHALFKDIFRGADGWYGISWVTLYDQVPGEIALRIPECFPVSEGFRYWLSVQARAGGAKYELWKWDGRAAVSMGVVVQECTTDGFIDGLPPPMPPDIEAWFLSRGSS